MDFIKDLTIDSLRNAAEDAFNQAKPKSEVEARVYEVLSHKNWGSSSSLMNDVARDTYDYDKFPIVTRLMWESIENQRPAAWRVVFKGLTLLEHLIKNGSERCVDDARNHSHLLKKHFQFNYYEGKVDRGLGVREKSKLLVELLSDDERIREERSKAKQFRERFGTKMTGVGSHDVGGIGGGGMGGGGMGGGGGGGSQYGGYGNDTNWENRGSSGAGGGYGESGIGGRSSGGYNDSSYGGDSGGGFSGRYSDDSATRAAASASAAPTFATIPDEGPRKKVIKKKKKKAADEDVPAPQAEPVLDLFSFDAPVQTASVPAANAPVAFDAFGTSAPVAKQGDQFDDFGAFTAAPAPAVMSTPQPAAQQSIHFDAFAPQSGSTPMNQMNNAFGQMNVSTGMTNTTMNGNGMMQQPIGVMTSAPAGADDDFGDFEDAAPKKSVVPSNDPLSRLIQLDGLSKNQSKKPSTPMGMTMGVPTNQSTYGQNPTQYTTNPGFQSNLPSNVPFAATGPAPGGADVIGLMSPQAMMTPQQQPRMGMHPVGSGMGMPAAGIQPQMGGMQPQMGGMQPQMGGMQPQMGGMQPQMGGMQPHMGMMQPQMGMMMQNQQGMMSSPMHQGQGMAATGMGGMQQGGMMMNPQMMQQPQQGGMNPQMMQGGMGMQGGMMGGGPMGGQMGGQPMQGWR